MDRDIFAPQVPVACEVLKEAVNAGLFPDVLHVCREQGVFEYFRQVRQLEAFLKWIDGDELVASRLMAVLIQAGLIAESPDGYRTTATAGYLLFSGELFSVMELLPPPGPFAAQLRMALGAAVKDSVTPEWGRERLLSIGASSLLGGVQETMVVCDMTGRKSLLDLGGGHGLYSAALARKYPDLAITLLDLPAVVPVAQETAAYFGVGDRIRVVAGDFLQDDIGQDYDVIFCANVIGPRNLAQVLPILRRSMRPGGRLIIRNRIDDAEESLDNALSRLVWAVRGGQTLWNRDQWQKVLEEQQFIRFTTLGIFGIFAVMTVEKN
ncbi:MAG TPA: methyltransferase [Patescibacteria group bacterium]|nr:methyltransferase [Patescibacteria group bacterium]